MSVEGRAIVIESRRDRSMQAASVQLTKLDSATEWAWVLTVERYGKLCDIERFDFIAPDRMVAFARELVEKSGLDYVVMTRDEFGAHCAKAAEMATKVAAVRPLEPVAKKLTREDLRETLDEWHEDSGAAIRHEDLEDLIDRVLASQDAD